MAYPLPRTDPAEHSSVSADVLRLQRILVCMEASTRKNPDKLSGPEKVRFLSVLGKDPDLQQSVIERLHEVEALAPDPTGVGDQLRSGAEQIAHGAAEAAREVAASPAVRKAAARAQQVASRARARIGR